MFRSPHSCQDGGGEQKHAASHHSNPTYWWRALYIGHHYTITPNVMSPSTILTWRVWFSAFWSFSASVSASTVCEGFPSRKLLTAGRKTGNNHEHPLSRWIPATNNPCVLCFQTQTRNKSASVRTGEGHRSISASQVQLRIITSPER